MPVWAYIVLVGLGALIGITILLRRRHMKSLRELPSLLHAARELERMRREHAALPWETDQPLRDPATPPSFLGTDGVLMGWLIQKTEDGFRHIVSMHVGRQPWHVIGFKLAFASARTGLPWQRAELIHTSTERAGLYVELTPREHDAVLAAEVELPTSETLACWVDRADEMVASHAPPNFLVGAMPWGESELPTAGRIYRGIGAPFASWEAGHPYWDR